MIKSYFLNIYKAFYNIWWITLPVLVIFIIAFIIICIFTLMCTIDATYRPNTHQHPYNIFLDKFIPLIFISSPTIFICWLNPKDFFLHDKFLVIIIIHLFLIIPLMHLWSRNRNWFVNIPKQSFLTVDDPVFYKTVSIALIYPALWGIYFSLLRYFRLGTIINIKYFFSQLYLYMYFNYIILFIFLIPLFFVLFKFLFKILLDIRFVLWINFSTILRLIHLWLLKYKIYFVFYKNFYKISFIIGRFVSLAPDIYPQNKIYSNYRYLLQKFYMKPSFCFLTLIICIFVEFIFFKGNLYYSLYLLFVFPILYFFCYILYISYTNDFITDICNVDYYYKNWQNPRYPLAFWSQFEDSENRHGFNWIFSPQEIQQLRILGAKYLRKKVYSYPLKLPYKVQSATYCVRLRASFYSSSGIRWVHSSAKQPLHTASAYFLHKFSERAILMRESWLHYKIILKAEKLGFITTDIYSDFYLSNSNTFKDYRTLIEQNCLTNFVPLINNGVNVSLFDKNVRLDTKTFSNKEEDLIFDFSKQNSFINKRIHAMDQKSGHAANGNSTIFSDITDNLYFAKLRQFKAKLLYHNPSLNHALISSALDDLYKTRFDLTLHQKSWANNLHLFTNKDFIPPLKVSSNFSLQDLNPKYKETLVLAELRVEKVSNYLYFKNIPQVVLANSALPPEALNLFQDSFLQEILKN